MFAKVWRVSARSVAAAAMVVTLTGIPVAVGTAAASVPHATTANPTCAVGIETVCIQAWSNGITFSWTNVGYNNFVSEYGWIRSDGSSQGLVNTSCWGDNSAFAALPPGEWQASAMTYVGASNGLWDNAELIVGGPTPAPTATCQTPITQQFQCTGHAVGGASTPSIYGSPPGEGDWQVNSSGSVCTWRNAGWFGDASNLPLNKGVVGMAATPDGKGYWLLGGDGGVFSYGDARFYGSTGNLVLNKPAIGMASTPDGGGYWFVASDGGVFAYGDAVFHGSMGGTHLNKPIVGIAVDEATGGYWMVASDGGVFAFNAPFEGSTGNIKLSQPIVGMEAAADGTGYRFVGADGGVFCFNQPFVGSGATNPLVAGPAVGIILYQTSGYAILESEPTSGSYWQIFPGLG